MKLKRRAEESQANQKKYVEAVQSWCASETLHEKIDRLEREIARLRGQSSSEDDAEAEEAGAIAGAGSAELESSGYLASVNRLADHKRSRGSSRVTQFVGVGLLGAAFLAIAKAKKGQ